MFMRLTLELSGRCREECQDTATHRSGPLERIVALRYFTSGTFMDMTRMAQAIKKKGPTPA